MIYSFLGLLSLSVVTASLVPSYTRIPFGREVLSHCLHKVPSGAYSSALQDGTGRTKVVHPDGTTTMIPRCDTQNGKFPVFRMHGSKPKQGPLPPDYDGWLQYTELNITDLSPSTPSGGFDAFTSFMSVPDEPKKKAQVLYFFPGLQNIDWIPKVDPEPTEGHPFDIIQPVLQYPGEGGLFGGGWTLKSWYVTVNAGALYSEPINNIKAGDAIFCNMTRTGPYSWVIRGTLKSDPKKSTEQSATNKERLGKQPWAYSAVAECYGCRGCETFPTEPITFSDNKLYTEGVQWNVAGSEWKLNPKPAAKAECKERTVVAPNGDATISFQ